MEMRQAIANSKKHIYMLTFKINIFIAKFNINKQLNVFHWTFNLKYFLQSLIRKKNKIKYAKNDAKLADCIPIIPTKIRLKIRLIVAEMIVVENIFFVSFAIM